RKEIIRSAVLVVIASVFLTPILAQQHAPQNESIRQEDLRADLFFLAGDSLRGRLTDTEENRAAAHFIRSRFEPMGLKPAASGNSYFQPYNLMTATIGPPTLNVLEVVDGSGLTRQLAVGQEFYPPRFTATGSVSGAVAFAGFGISAPPLGYDDYSGDVKGKIV